MFAKPNQIPGITLFIPQSFSKIKLLFLFFILALLSTSKINAQTQNVAVNLSDPSAMVKYGDYLYIAESGPNNRIVKVDASYPSLPTVVIPVTTNTGIVQGMVIHDDYLYYSQNAWSQVSRLDLTDVNAFPEVVTTGVTSPTGLAIHGDDLYISNALRVSKVDLTTPFPINNPTTVVDQMSNPEGLAVRGDYLYIVESGDAEVVRIDMNDSYPAPTTMVTTAGLNLPKGITIVNNDMYIAEVGGNRVSVFDLTETFPIVPTDFLVGLNAPTDVTFDEDDIYVSEYGEDKVYKVINLTAIIVESGGTGTAPGNISSGGGGSNSSGCTVCPIKIWIGRYNPSPYFNSDDNWYPHGIPGVDNDVIVTNGGLTINSPAIINSIHVQKGINVNLTSALYFDQPSLLDTNATFTMEGGTIDAGGASLTMLDGINEDGIKSIGSSTNKFNNGTLINETEIRLIGSGNFETNGTIINTIDGKIIIENPDAQLRTISGGQIINYGMINKLSSGTNICNADLINNGTLRVSAGTFDYSGSSLELHSGTYEVLPNATWIWGGTVTIVGGITSLIEGEIELSGTIFVPEGNVVSLDLEMQNPINWSNGTITGGGTLNLVSDINLTTYLSKTVQANTNVNLYGTMNLQGTGPLSIGGIFDNTDEGIIDFQAATYINTIGGTNGILHNEGLIKKTTDTGLARILALMINNGGTIQSELGTFELNSYEKIFNSGTFNVSENAFLEWNAPLNITGTLQGNVIGVLSCNSNLTVASGQEVFFDFDDNDDFQWVNGTLTGEGTMINSNVLKLHTYITKTISEEATLNNEGTLKMLGTGNLNVRGTLNNPSNGIIDMQVSSGGHLSYNLGIPGILNNEGLIKKSTSDGLSIIYLPINNNNGTIQAETGTLSLTSDAKNFIDGTYNVFEGAIMNWDTQINPSGTLSGNVDGVLNWNNSINVPIGEEAFLDFNDEDNFRWRNGSLIGEGVLTNVNVLNLYDYLTKTIVEEATLNNEGTLKITGTGNLNVAGILNNPVEGIIDMQMSNYGHISYINGAVGALNNEGLIKKTTSEGTSNIYLPLNNNDGTIQAEVGTLNLTGLAKNLNDGTYNVFEGASMDWDTQINLTGTIEGTVVGPLIWYNDVNVVEGDEVFLNFDDNDNFQWYYGSLIGSGILTNSNILKLTSYLPKTITEGSTLKNEGTLEILGSGNLNISGTLNNPLDGIIDLQVSGGGHISYLSGAIIGILNNEGLIKKTTTEGVANIYLPFNNNNGTLQAELGTLRLYGEPKNLNDGTYNVFEGAALDWDTQINVSGTLAGNLVGDLIWDGTIFVPSGEEAFINFDENDQFFWRNGTLGGGGMLTNLSVINLYNYLGKTINDSTTLNNEGLINIQADTDLYLNHGYLVNAHSGTIDLQANGGNITWSEEGTVHHFENYGLLKRTTTIGASYINSEFHNYGTIEVASGELVLSDATQFTNEETGIVKGTGIFDLPADGNTTNLGTFAPGSSTGTLTVQGDYTSTPTSVLDIEIDGFEQGVSYDLLSLQDDAEIKGTIHAAVGTLLDDGDVFTILTADAITLCELPTTIESSGLPYTFDVICNADNITLSVNPFVYLNLKVFLEGPYDSGSGLMNDNLRSLASFPTSEPYTALGEIHDSQFPETIGAGVLEVTGNNAIVDWVFVEVRDGENPTEVIETQAALVQRDGDIVSAFDGTSLLVFKDQSAEYNSIVIAIKHRNHFGVRNINPIATAGNDVMISLDFSDPSISILGADLAMNNIDGVRVMVAGDANRDGAINPVDKNNYWRVQNGNPYEYFISNADFNLDGIVNPVDKNAAWRPNNSKIEILD